LLPDWPFNRILSRIDKALAEGSLEAHLPDGSVRLLGGRAPGFACVVRLSSWRPLIRLALSGSVGWYEGWAKGEWDSPDPVPLFALFMANARRLGASARPKGPARLAGRLLHALRRNSRRGSRRNIADHYDLGNDFYRLWLDAGLTYSSAMPAHADEAAGGWAGAPFRRGSIEPLEQAQTRKLDAILDRLDLADGDRLLEIGCGWGSLAERALGRARLDYVGLTLSEEQRRHVHVRLSEHDNIDVRLEDYRDAEGQFDAIASIEMVEAVGRHYWPAYVAAIERLLKPGGRAAIQLISIDHALFPAYARGADFIQRYIFPGGCLVDVPEFRAIVEARGLVWHEDVHAFGHDYAWTLRQWRARFDASLEAGQLPRRFDAQFVALWRYYLMYCEGGFLGRGIDVMQVTLSKPA
jgi:cyclopropane-fatty-acyl-phospholipid synthase